MTFPTTGPQFQKISSPFGDSPFDKGLSLRDRVVFGFIKKINPTALAISFADEVEALNQAVFPGSGGFASGGGPLE